MKLRFPVVIVEWGDAFIETDDFDLADAKKTKPVMRYTVGYKIAENQHGIVLATDYYKKKSDGVNAKMFIPHGMVTRVFTCGNPS